MRFVFILVSLAVLLLTECSTPTPAAQIPTQVPVSPTSTTLPSILPTVTKSPTLQVVLSCGDWQAWPVIPVVSGTARELYQRGQVKGNNPHAFSKIGDGEISTAWFFTAFDLSADDYDLGPYQDLRSVIAYFEGSFGRIGMAAR